MKLLVLGGDGFCGWPTALHLSANGAGVVIVDNLSRRRIDKDLGVQSLTPIAEPQERLAAWAHVANQRIEFANLDLAREPERLADLLQAHKPDAVIHFAEQRSAPYSMLNATTQRYTVDNNIIGTHNLLNAIVHSRLDIHLVHLGTMGVYGYQSIGSEIPEGYLDILVPGRDGEFMRRNILYPPDPGSVYHMAKVMDQVLFYYYNKNYGIRITDLHQAIVWGTTTRETLLDPALENRFDYDGQFGTVLNRFLAQAAIGYPLTVYGTGGQQRAFIHITDSVRCFVLALKNPPTEPGRVRIFNQATEVYTVYELAQLVSRLTGVDIEPVANPRIESEDNQLRLKPSGLLDLGLVPTTLSSGMLEEVMAVARRHVGRVDPSKIPCRSNWRIS